MLEFTGRQGVTWHPSVALERPRRSTRLRQTRSRWCCRSRGCSRGWAGWRSDGTKTSRENIGNAQKAVGEPNPGSGSGSSSGSSASLRVASEVRTSNIYILNFCCITWAASSNFLLSPVWVIWVCSKMRGGKTSLVNYKKGEEETSNIDLEP